MIRTLLSSAAVLALAGAATSQDYAIVGGKVWTGSEAGTIENGAVIIDGGVVSFVGPADNAEIGGLRTIDASGKWVTPGIISAYSRVGLAEVSAEDSTNDTGAATTVYNAALDASDGFNPAAASVAVTRIEGVTRIAGAPAATTSPFAGQGFIADTSGNANSVTAPKTFMHVALNESGAALAGGSRPALWTLFRSALADSRMFPSRYQAHKEGGDALNRIDAEAFAPAARGDQLILVSASRASDLLKVIEIAQARPELNVAIVGAEEGWTVASELADAGIPVIVDPFRNLPERFEQLGASQRNAERLVAAGVETAFAHLGDSSHQSRLVLQSAGNAVANGVDHDAALAAITAAPARIFGLNDHGTLEEGKVADIVIWDGDPLEVSSSPDAVIINGAETSLETRQTKLRDRYLGLAADDKPYAYRKP